MKNILFQAFGFVQNLRFKQVEQIGKIYFRKISKFWRRRGNLKSFYPIWRTYVTLHAPRREMEKYHWNVSEISPSRSEKSHSQSEMFHAGKKSLPEWKFFTLWKRSEPPWKISHREMFMPWNSILERKNDSLVIANVNVITLQKNATSNLTIKSWRKRDTKLNSKKKKRK